MITIHCWWVQLLSFVWNSFGQFTEWHGESWKREKEFSILHRYAIFTTTPSSDDRALLGTIAMTRRYDFSLSVFIFIHSLFFISFTTTNQPLSRARYDSLQVKEWMNSPRVVASLLESQQKRQKCGTFRSKSWIKELLILFSVASSDEARRARSQLFANRLTVKKIMFAGRESKLAIVGTMM